MDNMTRRAVAAQIAVTGMILGAFDRLKNDDRGQGSVEYVGIILVVVAIVLAVVALVKGSGIDQVIIDAIKTAIESING